MKRRHREQNHNRNPNSSRNSQLSIPVTKPRTNTNTHSKKPKRTNKDPKKPRWTPICKKTTKEARKACKLWRFTLLPSDQNNLSKLEAIKKKNNRGSKKPGVEQPHRINGQKHHSILEVCQTNDKETINAPNNRTNNKTKRTRQKMKKSYPNNFARLNEKTEKTTAPNCTNIKFRTQCEIKQATHSTPQYQSRNWRPTSQEYLTKLWVETGYTTKCLKT